MSATQAPQPLAGYREAVADQMNAGKSFGDVEDAIDEAVELTTAEKAALWLFAFSLRDRDEQQRVTRAYLAALQLAGGAMVEQARPRQPSAALHAVSNEPSGFERGGRREDGRGQVRSRGAADRAHPLEFDERGFPVAQRSASFGERVDRLLTAV
jgi:hypothetical protein